MNGLTQDEAHAEKRLEVRRRMTQNQAEISAPYVQEIEPEPDIFGQWGEFADELFKPRPPIEYVYPDLLPKGLPGGVFASGGTGKTFLCLMQALYGAAGLPFSIFQPGRPIKTMFYCAEDDLRFLLERMENIISSDQALKERLSLIKENCHIKSLAGEKTDFLEFDNNHNIVETEFFQSFLNQFDAWQGVDLIIIDPLVSFWGLTENESQHGKALIRCLTKICMKSGASVQAVHHVSKSATIESISTSGGRGTSAIYDGLRWAFGMVKIQPTISRSGKDDANPELTRLRNISGDKFGRFVKLFSAKSSHAKEMHDHKILKRGEQGQLEPFEALSNDNEAAKLELVRYIRARAEPLTESELVKQTKGRSIRETLAQKYCVTQPFFRDIVAALLAEGKLITEEVKTTTRTKVVLRAA